MVDSIVDTAERDGVDEGGKLLDIAVREGG